jgi:hypothetical protein
VPVEFLEKNIFALNAAKIFTVTVSSDFGHDQCNALSNLRGNNGGLNKLVYCSTVVVNPHMSGNCLRDSCAHTLRSIT